ncbi:MAG: hypothetical protein FJX23_02150 [Alphaproteobacteria bacterium]|nr:hypothetical protein [Alphaproteobacteria bacterium]
MDYFSYRHEIYRKLFHLTSLWMPYVIWSFGADTALLIFGAAFVLVILFEAMRRSGALVNHLFRVILRPSETGDTLKLTGAFYMLLGAIVVTFIAPAMTAATALTILMVSDSLAALIGRKFGKHPFAGKSIEGSAAFFLSALIIVAISAQYTAEPIPFLWAGAVACIAATFAELYAKHLKLDDNLCIPVAFTLAQMLCLLF